MMMFCLRISPMRLETTRAMMSLGPPGGNGTISRIGLFGKSCAWATAGESRATPRQRPAARVLRVFTESSIADRGLFWLAVKLEEGAAQEKFTSDTFSACRNARQASCEPD